MADFNVKDKITLDELSDDLRYLVIHGDGTLDAIIDSHTNNNIIHISQAERDLWNSKVDTINSVLKGTPTAPTTTPGIYNTQIATTQFVKNELDSYAPARTANADKLTNPVSFTISGKVLADPVSFDGSKDVVINVKTLNTSGLDGIIAAANLSGTYDISVTGNAATATNSISLGGVNSAYYALLDSPQFTGNVTAPTQALGDNSSKLATTQYVESAIINGSAKQLLTARTFSIGGLAVADPVSFNGTDNVALEIKSIDQEKLTEINAKTVNGHQVLCDVPADAKFTDNDTIYVHPVPANTFTGGTFTQFSVDGLGHVIDATNPSTMDINITGIAEKANSMSNRSIFRVDGAISLGKIKYILKGSVASYSNLATEYKTPDIGWLVKVIGEQTYYRYTENGWQTIYADEDNILSKLMWKDNVATFNDIATTYTGTPLVNTTVVTLDDGKYYKYNSTTVNGAELKSWIDLTTQFTNNLADTVFNNYTVLDPVDSYNVLLTTYLTPVENSIAYINKINSKFIYTSGAWKLLYISNCQDIKSITKYTGTETITKSNDIPAIITTPSAGEVVTLSDGTHYIYKDAKAGWLPLKFYTYDDTTNASLGSLIFVNSVNSYSAIKNTYPITPDENWILKVEDKGLFYRFNGSAWEIFNPESTIDRTIITYLKGGELDFNIKSVDPLYVTQSSNYRFVTDNEKAAWNAKAETSVVTDSVNGLMIAADKAKLDGIEANANNYTHPTTHPADMIVTDTTHEFVTDEEKTYWNNKSEVINPVTTNANGLMSKEDKIKLDGIEANANKYTHPDTHAATMIVEDATHRFTTDTEKSTWNAKATTAVVTTSANGLMISTDKAKLDGIEANANKYTHPTTHAATMITTDSTHEFVTDTQINTWNNKSEVISPVTTTTDGLMSKADKAKLDGIEANANKYVHPTNHAPSIITQDTNNRFVTDTQISTWNNKSEVISPVTTTTDGLMSKADKTKLDGIATGANNYTHPSTHPATMIVEDTTHRFATDTQISTWNNKSEVINPVTTTTNGLMISTDKAKLDGIEANANKYTHPTTHAATMITTDSTHEFVTDTQINTWNDKYTKTEIDSKISSVVSGLDWKESVATYNDIATTYASPQDGWTVNVKDTDITYKYNGSAWIAISANAIPVATTSVDGKMSAADKAKLDGIEANANKYTHPTTHAATMITTDSTHEFVTDTQISTWNAKASTDVVTTTTNGLMISTDKVKLDTVATGANNYTHPSTHAPSIITQDSSNRFVTDTQISTWNNKASTDVVTTTTNGLMISTDKVKLDGIEANANKYIHPTNHAPSIITQDANNRFVTDTQISTWNNKASTAAVTTSANGLMISTDKTKLDGIAAGANNYVHPTTHAPSIIAQDSSNRFVTDAQISLWSTDATGTTDGLMSKDDKTKLDGIATGANNYVHPTTHAPSIIAQDSSNRFVTDSQIASWDSKAGGTTLASTTANGLMSKADKTKLDGIATGANNYTHPSTHPATMIVEDTTHRFATDTEKSTWDAKASSDLATTTTSGLMAYGDKTKLDGIATGANNYTHPSTHPASMITGLATVATSGSYNDLSNKPASLPANGGNAATVNGLTVLTAVPANAVFTDTVYTHPTTHPASIIVQDSSNRFVTDAQITAWNAKASTSVATTSADGLMSSTYVTKLLGIAEGANNYTHPDSGITAGTYRSVTVDSKGHVTAGTTHVDIDGHATIEWDSTTNSIVYNFA